MPYLITPLFSCGACFLKGVCMFTLFFPDGSVIVDKDTFFDFIGFFDSKFFITVILSHNNSKLLYMISETDNLPDYDDDSLWSLVGICTDSDTILKYRLDNGY